MGAWSGADVLAALAGVGLVLAAVALAWDDGLVAGSALLFAAYTLTLADKSGPPDPTGVLVAVALLGVVELGAWSLEFHDGAEEKPLARLLWIAVLLGGGITVSWVVLLVGHARFDAGLVGWVSGAAAALALFALLARHRLTADGAT